jgi:hypothetical protein
MIFVANGQLIGDNVDFAFLGQARSQRTGTILGPFTTTNKSLTNNVATLITGNISHGFEVGDTVTVDGVDTLTTYATAFPIVRARATENVTTDYVKNIVLVSRASNVATLTLDASHDYLVGESVVVAGADAGYNGTFSVTAVTSNTVSFANTGLDEAANVSVGTTTVSRTVSTTFVTLTTSEPHGFLTGEEVVVSGVASVMNGTFPIYDVPSTTTFRYVQAGPAQTPTSSGGSAQVARTVGATFNGTHTITAVPTTKSVSFAKTAPDVALSSTTKININYVTSWSITNGVATIILTNPPTENIGDACVVQDVDPLINDTLTVTARSLVLPYSLSFEVPQDDVPSTTLVITSQKTVTSRNRISNVSTLTLSTNHDYIVGQQIVVAGVSASFNGTFIVTALPAANKVSYAQTATNINETASTGTITTSKPNPGTTTQTLVDQGTAIVTDPYRGSYSGLARNHSTGEWSIISGIESKPTSDIPWSLPSTVTNTLNVASLKATVDVSIGGGDLTASTTGFNLIDTVVTDLNFARTATTINMGANSGTITIGNPTVVGTQTTQNLWNTAATTVNFAGAATTLNIAAPATTFNLGNTATGAQTVNMFTASTGSSTYNLASGATASGNTKAINIGTAGASGSTTNINIGSSTAASATGTITLNANTVTVTQDPNAVTDLAVATKRYVDQRPTILTSSATLIQRGANRASGVTSTGNYFVNHSGAVTLTLPTSPSLGDEIVVTDITGLANQNNITISRNGQPIQGLAEDLIVDIANATIRLVYSDTSRGWRLMA